MKNRLSKLQKDILIALSLRSDKEYKLRRQKLLFTIFGWQEYNRYTDECDYSELRTGYYKKTPPGYAKKQVSLTRSLQTLCGSRLIDLLNTFGYPINPYNKGLAVRLGVSVSDLEIDRKKALEDYKTLFEKDKKKNPGIGTFDEWFVKPFANILGERTNHYKLFTSNYSHRNFRNAVWVQLTEQGIKQVKALIVNYKNINPNLTIREL